MCGLQSILPKKAQRILSVYELSHYRQYLNFGLSIHRSKHFVWDHSNKKLEFFTYWARKNIFVCKTM